MKVKQVPADFVVEERAKVAPADRGRFALYLLRKQGIGTLEALRAVRRTWKVPSRDVGFGGLKDRHAVTRQWVTIPRGPKRNLEEKAFRLTYEGQCDVPMTRMALEGNAFRVRLRDLSEEEARRISDRFLEAVEVGVPAYFDDQRFGSLRGGGGFAALHLLRGDPESALKAVVASPSKEDRAPARERKRLLAKSWGDWEAALPAVEGTPTRAAVLHLKSNPHDFLGAFAALDRDERRLYASAYASAVWNRALASRLADLVPEDDRIVLKGAAGPLVFPKSPTPLRPLTGVTLPLPAPGARAPDPAWHEALEESLAVDGLALEQLSLPSRLGMDFRPTMRPVIFRPLEAAAAPLQPDDLQRGRICLDLAFTLGPGLYATILLKRMAYDLAGAQAFE